MAASGKIQFFVHEKFLRLNQNFQIYTVCNIRDSSNLTFKLPEKKFFTDTLIFTDLYYTYNLGLNELKSLIEANKEKYYSPISKRIINPLTSTKTYWSILKSFLNNKKIPCIPPLFHQNRYITKYKDKTELFNNFFANQCSLTKNSGVLPSVLFKRTENVISSIDFGSDDIAKTIQKLDPNKAHGHDMISIRMLKICGNSIYKPLQLIFRSCTENGKFPSEWKKANVVPVHMKGNKETLENYRPVSLLPICGKIFERLIYNSLFEFFIANELISSNQSGFKPGDSCINQLLFHYS